MIGVDEARLRVASRVATRARDWACDPEAASVATVRVALHAPTERQALELPGAVLGWRDAWATAAEEPGVEVEWEVRAWSRVGAQTVPVRVTISGADALAAFAGRASADAWARMRSRVAIAIAALGGGQAVATAARTHATALADYAEDEFASVLAAARWICEHPVDGMRPRQLPIRGVDSKWFASHRAVVSALVLAATGRESLGVVGAEQLFRARLLDDNMLPGAPRSFGASIDELARLEVGAPTVLVLENLETLLSLPPLDGVVAVHGSGFAVAELARVPWIVATQVLYWGDLDSNGFAILHRLRTALPRVRSLLMDEAVLLAHRDLWVPEPKPARGSYPTLEAHEQAALDRLRDEGDMRLEQERIPWRAALERVRMELQG
ncbi:hypothetical protein FQ330_05740 [Agrococcus sediminis]|uniref:DUF3322 and DUF2220 domain-containing protein n=1 Tax=Agrococcus sediminis TaxID=2599924 RepID=A0A5M8QJT5_9MICO|nr:DUF3322 and DUF2220 domain-containing protein [Agrococcus sediminis]KAA6435250.1 hypothetical protein FQ330_05740 [Agrococcus sediminis]RWR25006.1 hypothetical protein D8Y24_03725 [Agrococcus lahaulensis]